MYVNKRIDKLEQKLDEQIKEVWRRLDAFEKRMNELES